MVSLVGQYENYQQLKFDTLMHGHGAIYGSTNCGKSFLFRELCLNGMYAHCKTICLLVAMRQSVPKKFVQQMKKKWKTVVQVTEISNKEQMMAELLELTKRFKEHREREYRKCGLPVADGLDMKVGNRFANMLVVLDDLHCETVKDDLPARTFQKARHVGIQILFITQTIKNTGNHDVIKENYDYVFLFRLNQNQSTLLSQLSGSSLHSAGTNRTRSQASLCRLYHDLVVLNKGVPTFPPTDTRYMYIKYAKQRGKLVSDVRTSVHNPKRQVCFEERPYPEDAKVLFAQADGRTDRRGPFYYQMRVLGDQEIMETVDNFERYGWDAVDKTAANKEKKQRRQKDVKSGSELSSTSCSSNESETESEYNPGQKRGVGLHSSDEEGGSGDRNVRQSYRRKKRFRKETSDLPPERRKRKDHTKNDSESGDSDWSDCPTPLKKNKNRNVIKKRYKKIVHGTRSIKRDRREKQKSGRRISSRRDSGIDEDSETSSVGNTDNVEFDDCSSTASM